VWQVDVIYPVDAVVPELDIICTGCTLIMVKTQSLNSIMYHIRSSSNKHIDMAVAYQISDNISHACWSHSSCKPEEFRSFLGSQHIIIDIHGFSQPACSKGTATIFPYKIVYGHIRNYLCTPDRSCKVLRRVFKVHFYSSKFTGLIKKLL